MVDLTHISGRMFNLDDDDLAIIVPTRGREDSLSRLVASVQQHARTVPVHAIRHPSDEYDHPHVTMWQSDAFPIGHLYRAVTEQIEADAYLFLDDDHSLTDAFDVADLREAWVSYPVWSLPVRRSETGRVIRDAAKCGGQIVRADAYEGVDGHGSDYLEDIELSLRLSWAGAPPKRYSQKVTVHHTGTGGGYRDHPRIEEKANAYAELSRLAERYDRIEQSSSSYYGYRETK